ncbi:hypothetical protein D3C87_1740150 [compost metagenome]
MAVLRLENPVHHGRLLTGNCFVFWTKWQEFADVFRAVEDANHAGNGPVNALLNFRRNPFRATFDLIVAGEIGALVIFQRRFVFRRDIRIAEIYSVFKLNRDSVLNSLFVH